MKIVVTDEYGQKIFPLEIADDSDITTVKALCEVEFQGKSSGQSHLLHNNRELTDNSKTLGQSGVTNDDMLVFRPARLHQPVPQQSRQQKTPQKLVGMNIPNFDP